SIPPPTKAARSAASWSSKHPRHFRQSPPAQPAGFFIWPSALPLAARRLIVRKKEEPFMAKANGGAAPFLISGGGIGGLITAYALARQGHPVHLFEQSPEFREVGAGIQLGPNIFRVLEKVGLKDAILADAHSPPAQEMRDALTGKLIASIPLGAEFSQRFGQPYAVTHRADIHGTFLKACQGSNLISLETNRKVEDYED